MKVERIAPAKKTKPPLELEVRALRAEVRKLKAELREERDHSMHMLNLMRGMSNRSARPCMCEQCTCTPARADVLRRR